MNVLVVAAHPDDELLGVAGTVALHAEAGDEVMLAVMCEGVSVRYGPERHEAVCSQTRQAAAILGAQHLHFGNLPEQRLDTLAISDVAREVETLIRNFEPEVIYTHFTGDINRDHRALAEAVAVAARPYAAPSVREILMFETPSSTEWGLDEPGRLFRPNCYIDIAPVLDKKLAAFSCYTAEVRPYPHPRSLRALEERARYWGSHVNLLAAEPFVVCRSVRRNGKH